MLTAPHSRQRPCPVCVRHDSVPLYANAMSPIGGFDMSYQVARCAGCGFIYAAQLPASAVYAAYYTELSKYDVMTSTAQIRPVDKVRMAATVDLCRPHLAADAMIADIGCGTGALLNAFQEAGWSRLYGIDPAPGASAKADTLFGLKNVLTGNLGQAAQVLPLDQAALVCLTGVLEHLPDLRSDLSALVDALHKDALILVEVPALERFVRAPLEPYGEFSLEHIQYFSTQSLQRLMAELGYSYLAHDIVALSAGVTDSLFGLFARHAVSRNALAVEAADPLAYLALSEQGMQHVLDKIVHCPGDQLVIYGAGSHSARLLPRLEALGAAGRVVGVVDGNPNLLGQKIGAFTVGAPAALAQWPDASIVISSFSAQNAIADFISGHYPNNIVRIYS